MSSPLVSVVIPAYNAEKCLGDALDSVVAQTYRPIEVIVVDDGSTDNTAKVTKIYELRHFRNDQRENDITLKYFYQKNGGPSKARNAGIRASKGEYIALLDADDLWTRTKLEKQVRLFERDPTIDIVFTNVNIMRLKNIQIEEFTVFQKKKLNSTFFGHEYIVVNPLEKLMRLNFMPTSSVIAKKACFINGGYFNEKRRYVEDWELWLKMSLYCNFGYVSDVCVHKKEKGDGLSSNELEMILSIINIFESFIEENKSSGLPLNPAVLSNFLKTQYKWTGYFLMKNRHKKLARSYFRKSLNKGVDFKTVLYYINTFFRFT
jgi:glycosyltransferase involved in cell wall biosynthesis